MANEGKLYTVPFFLFFLALGFALFAPEIKPCRAMESTLLSSTHR
jgi:hypothetical protein